MWEKEIIEKRSTSFVIRKAGACLKLLSSLEEQDEAFAVLDAMESGGGIVRWQFAWLYLWNCFNQSNFSWIIVSVEAYGVDEWDWNVFI